MSCKDKEFYYEIAKIDEELYKYMIACYEEHRKARDKTTITTTTNPVYGRGKN
jgi:hypothetical protein